MKNDPNQLDILINDLLDEMQMMSAVSDDYRDRLTQLERLYALKLDHKPERVSRDTLATVAANLAGVLLIIAYEQKHVMTSKAFGWRSNK